MNDIPVQNDLLSIDFKKVLFAIRLHKTLLLTFVVAFMSFAAVYLGFFRVESYKAEVVLTMSASAPSSALSSLLASLNATESMDIKLEAVNDLMLSPEFRQAIFKHAFEDKKFFAVFADANHLSKKYVLSRKLASGSDDAGDVDPEFANEFGRKMVDNLSVRSDAKKGTMSIFAHTPIPWMSVRLADFAGYSLVELNFRRKVKTITSLKRFLLKQMEDNRKRLDSYELSLSEQQKFHGLLNDQGEGNPVVVRYTKVQEEMEDLKRQILANADHIRADEHDLGEFHKHLADASYFNSNVYLVQLQNRIRTLAYELDLAKARNGADPADVREIEILKAELDTMSKTYRETINRRQTNQDMPTNGPTEYFQELEKNLDTLKRDRELLVARWDRASADFKTEKVKADQLPELIRNLTSLKRDISLASAIYLETEKRLQEVRFMEAETINDLSVLFEPERPEIPDNYSPERLLVVFGLLGLFFGSLAVLRIEVFSGVVHSKNDIEKICDQFLGTIPKRFMGERLLTDVKKNMNMKFIKKALIEGVAPKSIVLEEFPDSEDADSLRALRMHLLKFIHADPALNALTCKSIMITSPKRASGRSFIAANLAIALVKAEKRVLLVDLDLRNPSLHEFFPGCKPSDPQRIFQKENLERAVEKHSAYLSLLLLRGQTAHPPEILESQAVQDFFDHCRKQYDFVIFDSPAVLNAVDPSISSSLADLVVMIAESQKTTRGEFDGAIRKIRSCNNSPIYGVLNFSDRRRDVEAA